MTDMAEIRAIASHHESSIMGAKYISVVALSCLVYDRLLRFDDELADIWCNFGRRPVLKSWFLLGQYCTIIGLGYDAISLGILNTHRTVENCRDWIIVSVILKGLSMIGTEGIVMYRLRSLWYFNRPIAHAITAMVVVVLITTVVSISLEAFKYKSIFIPIPGVAGCFAVSIPSEPYLLVTGLIFVIWDIFNICIFTFNTFATPYLCSSDILKRFKRNGGRYFFYLLVVHLLFVFTAAFGRDFRLSTVGFVMALGTNINARIFHGIALEAEKYVDEYDATFLPRAASR